MMQWNKHSAARTKSQRTSAVIYCHEQSARSQEPNRPPARVYFFFFLFRFFFLSFFSISKGETNSSGEDVVENKHKQPLISLLTVISPTGLLYAVNVQPGGAGPPQHSAVEGFPPTLVVLWAGTVSRVGLLGVSWRQAKLAPHLTGTGGTGVSR